MSASKRHRGDECHAHPPGLQSRTTNATIGLGTQTAPFEIDSSPSPEPAPRNLPARVLPQAPPPDEYGFHETWREYVPPTSNGPFPPNAPSKVVVPLAEPVLCQEQADLVDLILSGRNVFYTGSAGCGKSTVLKAFVKRLKERNLRVKIIAPTGRAALDVNGTTTWSYGGWTPDSHKKPLEHIKRGAHQTQVYLRLTETDVLVIDEISMIENLHFQRLDALLKSARGNDRAFGGVQLVVTGDFCQLPPVKPFQHCIECGRELQPNKDRSEYKCRDHGVYHDTDKWAFRSTAWKECNFAHVNLTNIHRQNDNTFIDILQSLRLGNPLLPKQLHLLLHHDSETQNAVQLFGTRAQVKEINDREFTNLKSAPYSYQCLDHFKWNHNHSKLESKGRRGYDGTIEALRDHKFDTDIKFKEGMLVVLLVNLDISRGLVNGSQGRIKGFEAWDSKKMPVASQSSSRKTKLKEIELGSAAANGVPILGGAHAEHREGQIKEYIRNAKNKAWPIVEFLNGQTCTIYADCTVNELGDDLGDFQPYTLLSRTQIPLIAAWAMTMHKSQGMTLSRVIVDLSKTFEQGQAYVALSRARSLEGLKVLSFPAQAQKSGNPQVREFLREKFGIE